MAASPLLLAMALAISSSMDNFAVGLSVGLAGREMSVRSNTIIAVCNAFGALVSASVGMAATTLVPQVVPPLFAGAIFLYLGADEYRSWHRGDAASPLASKAADGLAWQLALPMTLNNLAGGAAGGAAGIGAAMAGISALVASFVLCAGGAWLGRVVGDKLEGWLEPRLISATIFLAVASLQARDAVLHSG